MQKSRQAYSSSNMRFQSDFHVHGNLGQHS